LFLLVAESGRIAGNAKEILTARASAALRVLDLAIEYQPKRGDVAADRARLSNDPLLQPAVYPFGARKVQAARQSPSRRLRLGAKYLPAFSTCRSLTA